VSRLLPKKGKKDRRTKEAKEEGKKDRKRGKG
jgi:hypothetical protein